jgi:hypothetical protein
LLKEPGVFVVDYLFVLFCLDSGKNLEKKPLPGHQHQTADMKALLDHHAFEKHPKGP